MTRWPGVRQCGTWDWVATLSPMEWFHPDQPGSIDVVSLRGSHVVGIRRYAAEHLARRARDVRGLKWLCGLCSS